MTDLSSTTVRGGFDFAATQWSTVLAAGEESSPRADAALEKLCRTYWYPLYAYVRRRGYSAADAEDMTQGFLASLLQRRSLRMVARQKGKFRSFLLAALNHFLADEWDKAKALKRGGGQSIVSLEEQDADGRYQAEPASLTTPEQLFDRRWALTIMETAMARLREEHAENPRQFEVLQKFLSEIAEDQSYDSAATQLNLTAGAVRVAVHRLRQAYRELVRMEVANTVGSLSEVQEELSYLLQAVRG